MNDEQLEQILDEFGKVIHSLDNISAWLEQYVYERKL